MQRITDKQLEAVVTRINKMTNQPETPWRQENGKNIANIGNYHLDFAYGGVKLVQMVSDGGGERDVLTMGFCTKRELYYAMFAFIAGMETKAAA